MHSRLSDSTPNLTPVLLPWQRGDLGAQATLDCAMRTASGIPVYTIIWLLITGSSGALRHWPYFVGFNAALLAVVAIMRYVFMRRLRLYILERPKFAQRAVVSLLISNGALWGVLTGICLYWPDFENMGWAMLLVTTGMCAASTSVMSMLEALRKYFCAFAIVPVVVGGFLNPTSQNLLLIMLAAVFAVYVYRSGKIASQDYWEALRGRASAEERSRELEVLSLTDPLTQIHNRLSFQRHFASDFHNASKISSPLSVLIIDLDHFKHVNDTYGHPFGDLCLKRAASALQSILHRPCDSLARYGGEEFVMLLPGADAAGAEVVAQRALQAVRDVELDYQGTVVKVTASIGVSSMVPSPCSTPEGFLEQADQALYRAKKEGRNRHAFLGETQNRS